MLVAVKPARTTVRSSRKTKPLSRPGQGALTGALPFFYIDDSATPDKLNHSLKLDEARTAYLANQFFIETVHFFLSPRLIDAAEMPIDFRPSLP